MIKQIVIALTLALGLLFRLYRLNRPVADWHSFRQADTASVTRHLFQGKGTFFLPTYHDLSNIASGHDNPSGYRLVEAPIYNQIAASISHLFPRLPLEISSRLTSILFSLLSSLLIFFLTRRFSHNFLAAYLAFFCFIFNPYSIYYSSAILPEPTAVFFMLACLYFYPKNLFFSGLFFSISILVKPYTAIIAFPWLLFVTTISSPKTKLTTRLLTFSIFLALSALPFLTWRLWINQYPQGIPASDWLFNEGNLRLRPAWFRWLFIERLGKLILGVYGTVALTLGFAYRKNHLPGILLASLSGIILYFLVIARGNIQHDYYQVLIVPFLSIITGIGYYYLLRFVYPNRIFSFLISLTLFGLSTFYSWYQVRDFYQINNPNIVTAGSAVNQLTPPNSIVIAPYNGDTAFLYQTNRTGYPIEIYDFNKLFSLHSQQPIYYVSTNYNDYTNQLSNTYPAILKNDKFIILKIK